MSAHSVPTPLRGFHPPVDAERCWICELFPDVGPVLHPDAPRPNPDPVPPPG